MRKTYAGKEVDVSFDPEVCIHAANCVRGLPGVFDTTRRPWISPDAAAADDVVAQVGPMPVGRSAGAATYRVLTTRFRPRKSDHR